MASTVTMQYTLNWARTQARMIPLVGVAGVANEPGLTICNSVLQFMLTGGVGPSGDAVGPFPWKFNRVEAQTFQTIQNGQDYPSLLTDLGWLEEAWCEETQSTADVKPVIHLEPVRNLRHSSLIGEPTKLCFLPVNNTPPASGGAWAQNNLWPPQTAWFGPTQLVLTDPSGNRWNVLLVDNQNTNSPSVSLQLTEGTSYSPADSYLFMSDNSSSGPTTTWQIGVNSSGTGLVGTEYELPSNVIFPPICSTQFLMLSSPSMWPTGLQVNTSGVVILVNPPSTTQTSYHWRIDKPSGSLLYTVYPIYQRKPPVTTGTLFNSPVANGGGTWYPFPDEYQYVYNQGVLALAKKQAQMGDWKEEFDLFIKMISAAVGYGDAEIQDVGASPSNPILIG